MTDIGIKRLRGLFMIRSGTERSSSAADRACSKLMMGVVILVTVMGCVSTETRERRALSEEFDRWLGQYKDTRIIEIGQPDRCVGQGGGSEICEWRVDGNALWYLYDADGIARRWKYTDRRFGEMKGAQDPSAAAGQTHESEADVAWKAVKDTFDDMQFMPGLGALGGQ